MKKNGFLVGDVPASTNPSPINYSSSNNYGIWTAEWIDGNSLPKYYFTATVAGGGSTITSSKSDADMIQVYESLDVVCLGVNYCTNYDVKSFCESDLCSIGGNDAPSTIKCGITYDNITGCTDKTDCGCNWNTALGKCGSDWNTESRCSGENLSIGTCSYVENSQDTCEGDGMLTRSLSAQWNWSTENTFSSNPDGLDYWQPTGSEVFRYDPMDYSGLRKSQNCVYIEDTFACPASAQVSFFGIYQLVIAIALVVLIYLIYALKKKNNSKHVKKHSRITVRKRRK